MTLSNTKQHIPLVMKGPFNYSEIMSILAIIPSGTVCWLKQLSLLCPGVDPA